MKRIHGIDVSTKKLAIATLVNAEFGVVELQAKARSWEDRLAQLYKQFFEFVDKNISPDDFVCIEDVPLVQNRQAMLKLVHVLAMCRVVFIHYEIDCFTVNVSSWKKSVIGDGRADKDKIKTMARQIFGTGVGRLSQDSIDALMIAKWGQLRLTDTTASY